MRREPYHLLYQYVPYLIVKRTYRRFIHVIDRENDFLSVPFLSSIIGEGNVYGFGNNTSNQLGTGIDPNYIFSPEQVDSYRNPGT